MLRRIAERVAERTRELTADSGTLTVEYTIKEKNRRIVALEEDRRALRRNRALLRRLPRVRLRLQGPAQLQAEGADLLGLRTRRLRRVPQRRRDTYIRNTSATAIRERTRTLKT